MRRACTTWFIPYDVGTLIIRVEREWLRWNEAGGEPVVPAVSEGRPGRVSDTVEMSSLVGSRKSRPSPWLTQSANSCAPMPSRLRHFLDVVAGHGVAAPGGDGVCPARWCPWSGAYRVLQVGLPATHDLR